MANNNVVYRAKKAATLSNPTSASTFLQSDNSLLAAVVYFPTQVAGSSASFRFRARGRVTTIGAHNATPKVSLGTSVTAASNTVIAAATARSVATTTAVWSIDGVLDWNGTSNLLKGWFKALNGSTATLDADAVTTSVTADLSVAGIGLSVEMTVATGGGDSAFLDELTLEQI
jgi:ferric iron reductase protein FhuF